MTSLAGIPPAKCTHCSQCDRTATACQVLAAQYCNVKSPLGFPPEHLQTSIHLPLKSDPLKIAVNYTAALNEAHVGDFWGTGSSFKLEMAISTT